MNKVSICIIGGGIHGLMSALFLHKAGFDVIVLEKNKDILQGTSGSTHNRAHVGYHYPRSIETAKECIYGLNCFKEKFPESLYYPREVYYLIEKNSKTSVEEYKKFCDFMDFPYQIEIPTKYIKSDLIIGGFKVIEPIFDIESLRSFFKRQNLNIKTSSEVISFSEESSGFKVICNNQSYYANIIINATYANANNILNILNLEEDMTEYRLQHTEVAIMKSKKYIPSLTIMDGPFVSLMPYANRENLYLLYDVINSILDEETGFFLKGGNFKSHLDKMIIHFSKYFNFDLEYMGSLYGSRPIPVKISDDSRTTRIISHKKHKGIYSILEGKFISAPLIADKMTALIQKDLCI